METRVEVADFEDWRDLATEAAELLQAGEVVALPTETVYGLAADALNEEAVAKVFAVKGRPSYDPLIVHLGSWRDLAKVAEIPAEIEDTVRTLTKEYWPGPLTVVLPKKEGVPEAVTAGLPTVAVRVSAHEVMREVAKQVGPIAAPSANLFGRISPTSAAAVVSELGGKIPLVVDGGACREGLESTIIKIEPGEKKPLITILRPGPITREELRKFGTVKKARPAKGETKVEVPGQLDSHYAPNARVRILEKNEEFVPEEGKSYALLSYRGDSKWEDAHEWVAQDALSPGSGKLAEAGVRLFFLLRQLDEAGPDVILVEAVSETGVGVALMDRLRRAASK
ncbi:L-threonylcarbamoyladenylate synthase [Roseibacillus ishigakijimensis]|uniref:Threonylcarbamoyl-AMP synthase n=1 Tax=Roseibacillus ishigakijimensis TaxID=454146 RepID=A0A934RVI1_9BACT|nr:L-threonylcarbamoyladenylate synthase [Roseibacillus ishigakijimensis]MBK1835221.1 threonylcarbamoyl-AMP synthase [Roseibacillus ishigakijimensis]